MIISGNRPPPFSRKRVEKKDFYCDEGSRGSDLAAGKGVRSPGLLHRTGKVLSHLRRADLRTFPGGNRRDMVEHSKPLPDIYLKACELLGVKPENAIAIEDSLNGIRSAAAARHASCHGA